MTSLPSQEQFHRNRFGFVDMNLEAQAVNKKIVFTSDKGKDGKENDCEDFENNENEEMWDNILRERLCFITVNGNGMNPNRTSHFLKAALATAVRDGKLRDITSLFRLSRKYRTPLDDGGASGEIYMGALMAESVANGRVDIVKELINNGADASQVYKGRTHLSRSITSGMCHMVDTLIRHGADINQSTPTGKSILHEAAPISSSAFINCLLDHGARPESKDNIQGNTPLHIACSYCNPCAVFALYDRGVEFNAVNNFGDTPLNKLLRPLTKADNFHNNTRLELARDLVKLGFALGLKYNKTNLQPNSDSCSQISEQTSMKSVFNSSLSSFPAPFSSLPSIRTKISATPPMSYAAGMCRSPVQNVLQPKAISCNNRGSHQLNQSSNVHLHNAHIELHAPTSAKSTVSSQRSTSLQPAQTSSTENDKDNSLYYPLLMKYRTKDDHIACIYRQLLSSVQNDLNLQQRCRLSIIHSIGSRPLASSLHTLGLPVMCVRYLKEGREG